MVSKKERQEMKKIILLLAVFIIVLSGCSQQTKLETPPWNEKQLEQMENEKINTVPIGILRF